MPKPGFITPSGFKKMMTGGTKGEEWGATALGYAEEIALEMNGLVEPEPDFTPDALQWGLDNEGYAEQAYKLERMCDITRIGSDNWIQHPFYSYIGGHIDGGLVGKDGLVEIKCPFKMKNHWANIKTAKQYGKLYKSQCQGYLWITDRKWMDFVSFDPRFPEKLQLSITRVDRDNDYISELEARAVKFWEIVQNENKLFQELKEKGLNHAA